MLMALGAFRFEVSTAAYNSLRDVAEYRWAPQDRVGVEPALQYLGPGPRTVEIDGVIFPLYAGGLDQINRMRRMAAGGAALLMVSGRGDVLGLWVIERVEETTSHHLRHGEPRKQEYRLALRHYLEEAA